MSNYKEIEFGAGDSIERAVQYLSRFKERGELVCGSFNGQILYSDIDTVDTAYQKITGKSKAEYDAECKVENDKYKEAQKKHKESIPELTKQWIENGNAILDEKYRELWAKCVPIRLDDLYQGMELKCCLDIVLELNNGCTLDKAKEIIESQGHSGMSFGLVRSMVREFCDRGVEFANYVM